MSIVCYGFTISALVWEFLPLSSSIDEAYIKHKVNTGCLLLKIQRMKGIKDDDDDGFKLEAHD